MAAYAIQFRRGTTTEHNSFTGLVGEVTVDTTKKTVVVHDGSTAGGYALALEGAAVSSSTSPPTTRATRVCSLRSNATPLVSEEVALKRKG